MNVSNPVSQRLDKTSDCDAEMSYLEIRIAEFQEDPNEYDGDNQAETIIQPHPLSAFLPPFIFTSHLSPTQKVLQPFPYNMSTLNGIVSWTITFALAVLFFWIQNEALHHFQLCRLGESRSMIAIYVVVLVVEFFLGICSSLYPLTYGCVLRWREGAWPSKERVWGSEGEWEADNEDEQGRVDSAVCFSNIAEYTLVGILTVGVWKAVGRDNEVEVERHGGMEHDEKLRLLEEGRN